MLLNYGVGEDSWELLKLKDIKQVNPKGNQSWIFIGRIDVEAETPILWPPDTKNGLIWKDSDTGRDWRQEEKGTTEDETVGWHHRRNGHEFEWTPGAGWWTGKPGLLQSMGSQRVIHNWATELKSEEEEYVENSKNSTERPCQNEPQGSKMQSEQRSHTHFCTWAMNKLKSTL